MNFVTEMQEHLEALKDIVGHPTLKVTKAVFDMLEKEIKRIEAIRAEQDTLSSAYRRTNGKALEVAGENWLDHNALSGHDNSSCKNPEQYRITSVTKEVCDGDECSIVEFSSLDDDNPNKPIIYEARPKKDSEK